ncbi:hypothetical protein [Limnohabitans sp. DM1]|uniref:hypothetical protein n=1 Tax=Limnohabitans sp. DM1 TaxID=1597955 RepID=UPI001892B91D|nr:hypothetical protein [Limnohabitans sp. DM1]
MVREYSRHLGQYEKLNGKPALEHRHGIKTVGCAEELGVEYKGATQKTKSRRALGQAAF